MNPRYDDSDPRWPLGRRWSGAHASAHADAQAHYLAHALANARALANVFSRALARALANVFSRALANVLSRALARARALAHARVPSAGPRRIPAPRNVLLLAGAFVACLLAAALLGALVASDREPDHGDAPPGAQRSDQRTPAAPRPSGPQTWYVAADEDDGAGEADEGGGDGEDEDDSAGKADDKGDGSKRHPFTDVQSAIDAALPGDVVRVGPGQYAGGLHTVRSGTPQARIRLIGHDAHITAGDATYLIEITHSYIDLTGFDLAGGNSTVRLFGAERVRVLNNTVRDAEGECVRLKYQSRRNEVAHNQVHGCGRENFDPEQDRKNGEAIYIGTAPEQVGELPEDAPDHSDFNWIHDNRLMAPAECVDVKEGSGHTIVEDNFCTGGQDPDGAGFSFRGDHGLLRSNTVRGGAGAGIRLGGDGETEGVNTTVVGNVVRDAAGYGVKVMRGPQAKICGNDVRAARGESNDGLDPTRPCGVSRRRQ